MSRSTASKAESKTKVPSESASSSRSSRHPEGIPALEAFNPREPESLTTAKLYQWMKHVAKYHNALEVAKGLLHRLDVIRKASIPGASDWFLVTADGALQQPKLVKHLGENETIAMRFAVCLNKHEFRRNYDRNGFKWFRSSMEWLMATDVPYCRVLEQIKDLNDLLRGSSSERTSVGSGSEHSRGALDLLERIMKASSMKKKELQASLRGMRGETLSKVRGQVALEVGVKNRNEVRPGD